MKYYNLIIFLTFFSFLMISCNDDDDDNEDNNSTVLCTDNQNYFFINNYTPSCKNIPVSKPYTDSSAYPDIEVTGENVLDEGQVQQFTVSSNDTIESVFVGVSDEERGRYFYYEIENESMENNPLYDMDVNIEISPDSITSPNIFLLLFKIKTPSGFISKSDTVRVILVPAEDGDLKVSLKWQDPVDLDLIFVEDAGKDTTTDYLTGETDVVDLIDTIYFDNQVSNNLGRFYEDENPSCYTNFDPPYIEYVEYDKRESLIPIPSNYEILVSLYSSCQYADSQIPFEVLVSWNGDTLDLEQNPLYDTIDANLLKEPLSVMNFSAPFSDTRKKNLIIFDYSDNNDVDVNKSDIRSVTYSKEKRRYF